MVDSASPPSITVPARIAQRYRVIEALGRGGMARVYHVSDEVSGQELALKQCLPPSGTKHDAVVALFESEFHTLAQLSHPRVIEVYDYGLTEVGPFYTMELLDGGDLYDRSPLPWREACALIYDVCSSLALLHSRRFVHRDVSPRNIRCTHDGRAKLIDFGTMVPMGHGRMVAGTPAFVAPEVVNRSALDGRADLFSLGATLYYALTRRSPFPARDFNALPALWRRRPRAPSSFDSQIPAALDTLALSLLGPDPALRPRTAFEVMQRLSAIADLDRDESLVSQAYLSTPTLVARESVLETIALAIEQGGTGRGSAYVLRAESGLGRSRVLDACVLEAKARGAVVLRASAGGAPGEAFALARTFTEQLLEVAFDVALESARMEGVLDTLFATAPDAAAQQLARRELAPPQLERMSQAAASPDELVDAHLRWLLRLSSRQLVVVAVDDIQRCDVSSASLLAGLAAHVERRRLVMALTVEAGAPQNATDAIDVLSGYCVELALHPLTRDQTHELLSSVFGEVPNLGVLTEAIHELGEGNPRQCMDLAQHLVDRGALRYAGGGWTLPAQIDPAVLPRSIEDAMRARIALLDPLALALSQAQALSLQGGLSRDDYAALRPDADRQCIDRALLQLLSQQVLVSDGSHYALARHRWASLLTAQLDDRGRRQHHLALARLYEQRSPLAAVHHWLSSDQRELGLTRLIALLESNAQDVLGLWELSGRMRPADLAAIFERAHRAAVELARPARERVVTAGWMVGLSIITDDSHYHRFAGGWRAQLELDSGFTTYRGLPEDMNQGERLMQALQLASERFAATPQAERVYPPDEAIRLLVLYVGISIAIGSRSYDRSLLSSLPELLEPYVALSPVIEAVRLNALASRDVSCDCRLEQGRARWLDVYQRLEQIDATQLPAVKTFRNAVAYALGLVEARIGLESARNWTERLDRDPTQRVNALYLRKVICLHHGDFEGAERWRTQAEIVALQTPMRQMFTNVVIAELWAHAAAGDLVGVKHALERIVPLSDRYPSWLGVRALAEAQFELIRGDLEAARVAFERCLELSTPDPREPGRTVVAWPSCVGSYLETLQRLGRYEQARSVAEQALSRCRELGIGISSHEISRGLALAEAKLGDFASAWARLGHLVDEQTELGIKGLQLGLSYEACTRIAIWAGDDERLQRYASLTAIEYRYGRGSPLGARYDRLMEEARSAGLEALPELTEFVSTAMSLTRAAAHDEPAITMLVDMSGARDPAERAQRALRLLCRARNAISGHLYLCTADGIAFAASEGTTDPPEGLREFLEEHLRTDSAICESATSIATEAELESVMRMTTWSDASGKTHQPLVLNGVIDGAARAVGVASFVDSEQPRRIAASLCSAVAAYLIDGAPRLGALPRAPGEVP